MVPPLLKDSKKSLVGAWLWRIFLMQLLSLVDFWMFNEAFTFPFFILVLWWVTDFICLFLLG
jgi:hypothetical protein